VVFGPMEKDSLRKMTDLDVREVVIFVPLILLIIWYGVQPGQILDVFAAPTAELLKHTQAALSAVKTAALAIH